MFTYLDKKETKLKALFELFLRLILTILFKFYRIIFDFYVYFIFIIKAVLIMSKPPKNKGILPKIKTVTDFWGSNTEVLILAINLCSDVPTSV